MALVRCFIRDNTLHIDHEAWDIGVELDDVSEFISVSPVRTSGPSRRTIPDQKQSVMKGAGDLMFIPRQNGKVVLRTELRY